MKMGDEYIMIVDDDHELAEDFGRLLTDQCGLRVEVAATAAEATERLAANEPAVIFLDLFLHGEKGGTVDSLQFLGGCREAHPATPVIIVTSYPDIPHVVDTIKAGAYDFLPRPLGEQKARLRVIVRNALELRHSLLSAEAGESALLGGSSAMVRVREQIRMMSRSDAEVLILGERGTGKELVAHGLHHGGPRAAEPLVKLLASAIPESLFESELFGHARGAFTSADRERPGAFEAAGKGTLFLDEISEMPLAQQVTLLRVLETGDFHRLGEQARRQRKCRVVAATNRTVSELIDNGLMRPDLFDRFDLHIEVPALREHKQDIPVLVGHFIRLYSRDESANMPVVDTPALECLMEYDYPGNVRELRNIIRRVLVLSDDPVIGRDTIRKHWPLGRELPPDEPDSLRATTKRAEREAILRAVTACDGNRTEAAQRLSISRQRLHVLLKEHGL